MIKNEKHSALIEYIHSFFYQKIQINEHLQINEKHTQIEKKMDKRCEQTFCIRQINIEDD